MRRLITLAGDVRSGAELAIHLEPAGLDVGPDGADVAAVVVIANNLEEAVDAVRGAAHRRRPVVVLLRPDAPRNGAWRLVEAGAADVLPWDDAERAAARIAARVERWSAVEELMASRAVRNRLVGGGAGWASIVRTLVETAAFTDVPLLITGESGTGKELAARLVHHLDRRPDKGELVVVDCTTIVATLSGSEFFGHEKGRSRERRRRAMARSRAPTAARSFSTRWGLEPPLQAELLRVVQEGAYKRVGSDSWRQTSFRLVCATNRNLAEDVDAGRFRDRLDLPPDEQSIRSTPSSLS